jgi:hypothetical protein
MHAAKKTTAKSPQRPIHPSHARSDEGRAFLPDPYDGSRAKARAADQLAETLAEEFVTSATGAELDGQGHDGLLTEELGGPFTESTGAVEFAKDTDASNPPDAEVEPFPTANRVP